MIEVEQMKNCEDNLNSNFIYFKSEKELIDYIRFNNINYFCIDDKNITDHKINFAYIDISKTLYINDEFYRKNKQMLDKYFIQNLIFASNIMMSKHIYNEDIIRKLISAETIIFEQEIEISNEILEFLRYKGIKIFKKDDEDMISPIPDEKIRTYK